MLSRKAKYGLKALLVMARRSSSEPVSGTELAAEEGLPKKFLEAILVALKRAQLVGTKKGKGGGYFLRRPASKVTFGDIIRALDGPLAPVACVSHTAYMPCAECLDERTCGVRLAMKQVRDASAKILDNLTLADVNGQVARKRRAPQSRKER